MRRHLTFACGQDRLVGTVDDASGPIGLLLVTGGNEQRSGAWAGQAQFAARIAAEGYPVFRFDRRGCGDSEGFNAGFRCSAPDLAAALAAFRAECPQVRRVAAMGNCDAASALMLARGAGCDALILSNPWTFENDDASEAPPQAVRDHYRRRLANPDAIWRLLTGKVAIGPLIRSLLSAAKPAPAPTTLTQDMLAGVSDFEGSAVILIAGRDRTGLAFLSHQDTCGLPLYQCSGAGHSYVEAEAREWLVQQTLSVLGKLT
jgi:exosortase A-associated hydrolase 1